MKTILVTGASGSLGSAAVTALLAKGFRVRAASRQLIRTAASEQVRLDYTDPGTHQAALEGVDGVLLIAPPLDVAAAEKLNPFIDHAKEVGVGEIVLNSALGVDAAEEAPLRRIELYLGASGIPHSIVRPNFFMENFSTGFLAPMMAGGGIYLAAGDGKTSFISTRDIAAVVAELFARPQQGKAYNLTGREALDHHEVAQIIGRVSDRQVAYHPISEQEMLQGAIDQGVPESSARFLGMLYSAVRNGFTAALTPDVREITGRDPLTFAQFAEANAEIWK